MNFEIYLQFPDPTCRPLRRRQVLLWVMIVVVAAVQDVLEAPAALGCVSSPSTRLASVVVREGRVTAHGGRH
ncbi:hypothetical protein E2C01_073219 [Portunus trituberculatus]|uniref:Uncharacterized protein n=1 Tax=Portunus trituberculatus TaxID=210409 RepID=A0A5B7I8V5_PORTR|nr:hypothetical protein [Portunus trituberculatus]